jgi:hypothetical protein
MPSPEHQTIARRRMPDSDYAFCLDRIIRHDKGGAIEYCFAWHKPDGSLIKEPAYFIWEWIGELIEQVIENRET